jgi:hypothetical protein
MLNLNHLINFTSNINYTNKEKMQMAGMYHLIHK